MSGAVPAFRRSPIPAWPARDREPPFPLDGFDEDAFRYVRNGRPFQLRVVLCRASGGNAHLTGVPGAAYCDEHRPGRLSDVLLTEADRVRERDLGRS